MREFDALSGYPEPKQPRVVSPNMRTIQHRIVASYRDKDLYDGDRNFGYGGFNEGFCVGDEDIKHTLLPKYLQKSVNVPTKTFPPNQHIMVFHLEST